MRAAIWLRVSTTDQTIENQRRDLLRFAEMRGFDVVREYDLTGVSAAQGAHKRFLSEVIMDARSSTDGFDVLLIWALDRLSRQGVRATLEIIERLHREGIGIASFREMEIDTTGPLGELVIAIFSAMARLESERISQRTMAGLDRARARGTRLGRPPGSKDKRKRKRRAS